MIYLIIIFLFVDPTLNEAKSWKYWKGVKKLKQLQTYKNIKIRFKVSNSLQCVGQKVRNNNQFELSHVRSKSGLHKHILFLFINVSITTKNLNSMQIRKYSNKLK